MNYKQSLARRIVIAFMLMTVAVRGPFSAGIVGVVHIIEERLISRDLGGELERILRRPDLGTQPGVSIPAHASSSAADRGSICHRRPWITGCRFPPVFEGRLVVSMTLVRDIDGRRFVPAGPERFRSARAGNSTPRC